MGYKQTSLDRILPDEIEDNVFFLANIHDLPFEWCRNGMLVNMEPIHLGKPFIGNFWDVDAACSLIRLSIDQVGRNSQFRLFGTLYSAHEFFRQLIKLDATDTYRIFD